MNDRPQHYVKLSAPAEVDLGRIAGVSPGRQLATMLLRDLLGERHELVVGHAQTSGNAEKLWLYGSRFTALVLVRANATDEFEVERVYPANPPTVGSIPYPAELELTHLRSGKRSADLRPLVALVRTAQPTRPQSEKSAVSTVPTPSPTSRVVSARQTSTTTAKADARPMLLIRPPVSTILDQLARRLAKAPTALRRRALDCAPTPMTHDVWWQATDAILALRGLAVPSSEAVGALAGDRQSSLRTCQQPVVAILNNIVELPRPFSNVDLYALVSDMLSLPLQESERLALWLAMSASLSMTEIASECRAIREAFSSLNQAPESLAMWARAFVEWGERNAKHTPHLLADLRSLMPQEGSRELPDLAPAPPEASAEHAGSEPEVGKPKSPNYDSQIDGVAQSCRTAEMAEPEASSALVAAAAAHAKEPTTVVSSALSAKLATLPHDVRRLVLLPPSRVLHADALSRELETIWLAPFAREMEIMQLILSGPALLTDSNAKIEALCIPALSNCTGDLPGQDLLDQEEFLSLTRRLLAQPLPEPIRAELWWYMSASLGPQDLEFDVADLQRERGLVPVADDDPWGRAVRRRLQTSMDDAHANGQSDCAARLRAALETGRLPTDALALDLVVQTAVKPSLLEELAQGLSLLVENPTSTAGSGGDVATNISLSLIAHRLSLGGARPVIRELCEALVAYLLCKAPPRQAVGALREAVSALGPVLPAPMAIDAQSDQVAMVAKQLGIDPQEPLEVGDLVHLGLSWTELHLALDLILTLRDQLPHWVFDGEIATATGALGAACRLAKDPIATAKLSEVRDELPKLSAQVKDLSALPRPRDMAALPHERLRLAIQSLQTASRQHQQIEALPSWIPEPVREELRLATAIDDTLVQRVEVVATSPIWYEPMHDDLRATLVAALVREPEAVAADLSQLASLPEPLRKGIAGRDVLDALKRAEQAHPPQAGLRQPVPAPALVSIGHALAIAGRRRKVELQLPDTASTYWRVQLPVQLTHDPAPKEDVELELEVGGAFLDSLLPAMRDKARSFGVRVPRGVSRVDALIPIDMTRVYAKNVADGKLGGALVVAFGVRNEGYSMGRVSEMSWDLNVAADKAPNASAFHLPQEPTPEDVERHPFGLQTKLKQLTDQITAAQRGFYVMGFRRFGKTSLVRAALARVRATGEVLVCDILNGRELRPKQVWEHALRFLCDALDCSHQLVFDDAMPPVPQPQCFDNVRRRAKEKGFRAVYIVIDEAQQFFAEHLGIADAIKARNEGWWGLGTSEMAPLFFGFVGTTSLARFAGSNLLQTLLPYKASAPTGPELREFLLAQKGLHSSVLAQTLLARQTANLWLFEMLYRIIAEGCDRGRRNFFLEPDVEQAVQRLVADLQEGREDAWSYLRDALNESVLVEVWEPKDSYPVAVALSYLCLEDVRRDDLAQACASYIKVLCENSVEVDPQRVEECFKTLIEDGVLDQDPVRSFRFRTPLLEHALRARAHNKVLFGAEVHASAARLGLRRVRRPVLDGASDAGSQGSVYAAKHPRRNTSVSVRLVRLAEPSQSEVDLTVLRRFQSEVKVLSRIGSIFERDAELRRICDRHLPHLVEAGLDESDSRVGVVIYDRIPGQTLLEVSRNEPLDTLAIVTIGFHLASALVALEAAEVVHRDIAARNVVLRAFSDLSERSREDTAIEPVLIDFGLASSVGAGSLIGHVPPEVTSPKDWTSKADVYALGQMLFELPRKGDGSKLDAELDGALTLARHRSPKDRPSAVELRAELLKLHLQARPTELGYREDAAKHASALPDRLRQLAIDALVGLRIGLPSRRRTRYSLLAFFLENALQVAVRRDAVVQARFFDALGERGTTMLNVVSHVRLPSAGPAWTRLVGEGGRSKRLGRLRNEYGHPISDRADTGDASDQHIEDAMTIAGRIDDVLEIADNGCLSVTKEWIARSSRRSTA